MAKNTKTKVTSNLQSVQAGIKADISDIPRRKIKQALTRWRFVFVGKLIRSLRGETDAALNSRTGELARNTKVVSHSVSDSDPMVLSVEVETLEYGMIHETGAGGKGYTQSKKYRAIPLEDYFGERAHKQRIMMSDYFEKIRAVIPRKNDTKVAYIKRGSGKNAEMVPAFLMVRKIQVSHRPWITDSFEQALPRLAEIAANIK